MARYSVNNYTVDTLLSSIKSGGIAIPEMQRPFVWDGTKVRDLIDLLYKGFPVGYIIVWQNPDVKLKDGTTSSGKRVLIDGQQRITSLGRFITGKFPLIDDNGLPHYYSAMPDDAIKKINETKLTIYICEGEETEIKEWFKTINISGIPLNHQEISNAVYSGPFVTLAKAEFSNSQNANIQKWSAYIKGKVGRQDYLRTALEWVARSSDDDIVDAYMSKHRHETNITELKNYFTSVIDWISGTFTDVESEMRGLEWGRLFEQYHNNPYNPAEVSAMVHKLYADGAVKRRKGIFEYILGGCVNTNLLEIRMFDDVTKRIVYERQTQNAKAQDISNCPLCALGNDNNKRRIYKLKEMDADHVTAWSNGGATDISNCTMLCSTHNKAKGNK
jgi:hypothetical protein